MMLDTELFKDTWLYKDGVKAGRKQGKLEGRREALRLQVSAKVPGVVELPELDHFVSAAALDNLLLAILRAKSEDDVRAAVQAAH